MHSSITLEHVQQLACGPKFWGRVRRDAARAIVVVCSGGWTCGPALRGKPSPFPFFLFFGFFISFIVFYFFYFKKVVVCWGVGPWVLFYLVSQSSEPTIGESEASEVKSWRED